MVERRWGDIRGGDILKIERNDRIPADLVLLGSSGDFGVSYVETKSLGKFEDPRPFSSNLYRSLVVDGETNLKHKVAIPDVNRLFQNDQQAARSRGLLCLPDI